MYKMLIMALLCLGFVYQMGKRWISWKRKDLPLPENIRDVYDGQAYRRWRNYSAEKSRLNLLSGIVEFILALCLFGSNVFSWIYYRLPGGEILRSVLLLTGYVALYFVIGIPFSYIRTFRIEEKYGFNKSTCKTFISDQIKEMVLELLLTLGIYLLAASLHNAMGNAFFAAFYGAIVLFMLGMSMFSMTFQKLFYKFIPLEDGELRENLSRMFAEEGFYLKDIYVKNASSRTTHANAFCAGLGKFKNISLDDNLVNNYTPGEITAVFAHELAHFKHRDTAKLTGYSLLMLFILTMVIGATVMVPQISVDFGFSGASIVFAVILLMSSVLNPVMTVLGIPQAVLSRACERRADRFAAEKGFGKDLISGLKKLHGDSLSDLNPHPAIVALEYSHPTLSQRVALVEKHMASLDAK